MLEILQIYVSGPWTWAGITFGIISVGIAIAGIVEAWRK